MMRPRFALLAFASVASLSCVESPRSIPRPSGSQQQRPPDPASIGQGDDVIVPQVHLPPRIFPPRVAGFPAPLGPAAALATLSNGGALLLWSSGAPNVRPVSQLALRAIAPDGTPGPIWELRRVPGTVRGIDMVMRGEVGMMIWNADIGGITSQISAERVRPDGTLIGSPFGIGTYRVTDPVISDAGPVGDHLGFPARVVATATGFAVAVRGTLARCGTAFCPSVRVAEVDLFDSVNGRGGVQNPDPTSPITLLGTERVPWTLAVTFGGDASRAHVETFGSGPLARLALRDGTLVAAWLHGTDARALVRRSSADPHGSPTLSVLGAGVGDAGSGFAVLSASLACAGAMPTTTLTGVSETLTVRADEPGADNLFAWAMEFSRPPAARPRRGTVAAIAPVPSPDTIADVTWIRDGLLVARGTRLELQRCVGTTLAAPTELQWEPPAPPDATATDAQ